MTSDLVGFGAILLAAISLAVLAVTSVIALVIYISRRK
jgi:hypothetical protein